MDIQHDKRQKKFFSLVDDIEYSIEYNEVEKDLWEFHCYSISQVNNTSRERAITDSIIEYILNYMHRNNIRVYESGSCFHIKDYLDKTDNFKFLIKYML